MNEAKTKTRSRLMIQATGLILIGVLFVPGLVGSPGGPSPQPADKVAVAGSTLEVMSAPLEEGSSSVEVTLLSAEVKTSKPTSLVLHVTAECALWTHVMTVGDDDQEAIATVKIWIEIDGERVAVTSAEDPQDDDLGKVVFCNRAHRQMTELFENENATIHQFLRTRSANAFNWVAIEVGAATHSVEVKAQLEIQATELGDATAAVGKRTLVVEPVKLPPGSTI